jgi:endonuclease/exonuclease/phosphatase family metal-dependent hydrolase
VRRLGCVLVCLVLAGGCAAVGSEPDHEIEIALEPIPPFGEPGTFDVATWNLEWFGSWHEGPDDEARQLAGVRAVIAGLDLDLWAVEEVVSASQFSDLLEGLPYQGLLANDPSVEGGDDFYGVGEQKVGVIYRPDQLEVVSARTILRSSSWSFAGRPPLEVELLRGEQRLIVIVLHAKAQGAFADWQRRRDGALALADYLASERAGDDVLVIGDYNDDLDQSMRSSSPSPYAGLAAAHFFATTALSAANVPTTVFGHLPIDHALADGGLADAYVDGSAAVFPADDYIDEYSRTTSDHLPVVMRFAGEAPPAGLLLNEILANEPGADTAGEFVEIVNPTASAVDASGLALSDGVGVRHVVPDGTIIAAGAALVIAGMPLGLDNDGDTVTLTAAGGGLVDRVVYAADLASQDGVSMTREVDGDRGSPMVRHDQVSSLPSSPGARRDGSPF